jgi:hypothetical protein
MSATNTENTGSPYEVEEAQQQLPNPFLRRPLPDHLAELTRTPVHIGGEPLSPTSAIQLVENLGTNVDSETMHFIAVGLAATLAKREGEHAAQAELFKRQIQELREENRECLGITEDVPEDYVENLGQAPGFVIPLGDNEYTAARYIQRRPHGRIAGHPRHYAPGHEPHIADIFATPAGEDAGTCEAMPLWFQHILCGHGAQFQALILASQKLDDWGIEADIRRYRDNDDQIQAHHFRIRQLEAELGALNDAQGMARFRLEQARVPQLLSHLYGLAGRPREGFNHRV